MDDKLKVTKCEVCGGNVLLHSSDEGTSYYEPINQMEIDRLKGKMNKVIGVLTSLVKEMEKKI